MINFRKFRQLNLVTSVIFFAISLLAVGYLTAGRVGLFAALLTSLLFVYFMLFHEITSLSKWTATKLWSGRDPWELQSTLAYYARKLQMPVPQVGVFDSDQPLIYSEAHNQTEGVIGISMIALARFTPAEVEALLVLSLVRLQHQQKVWPSLLFKLASILSYLSDSADRLLGLSTFRPIQRSTRPMIWLLTKLALSQSAIIRLDKKASELLPVPRRLAETLTRLHSTLYSNPASLPYGAERHMAMNFSSARYRWTDLHPAVEVRLKRLIGLEPV